jgi:hypothetical protein
MRVWPIHLLHNTKQNVANYTFLHKTKSNIAISSLKELKFGQVSSILPVLLNVLEKTWQVTHYVELLRWHADINITIMKALLEWFKCN